MWSQLKGYVDRAKEQSSQLLESVKDQFNEQLVPYLQTLGPTTEEVCIGQRKLRILKKIGEGGYSFVYLAEEVPPPSAPPLPSAPRPRRFALKQVLVSSQEQMDQARHEVDVMLGLSHPNLLPLADWAVAPSSAAGTPGAGAAQVVNMLFPLYVSSLPTSKRQ